MMLYCLSFPYSLQADISLYYGDVDDFNILLRLFLEDPRVLDLMYDIQALNGSSKNCVLVIQPRLLGSVSCGVGITTRTRFDLQSFRS